MNTVDAAIEVLREAGAPMGAADLADRVIAGGRVELRGKTPRDSVLARVYVEAKRPDGRIERVAPGTFQLREP